MLDLTNAQMTASWKGRLGSLGIHEEQHPDPPQPEKEKIQSHPWQEGIQLSAK